MKRLLLLCLLGLFGAILHAQTFGLPGYYRQQLFGNNGQPLVGAQVLTCAALSACPGTPQTTWTDSTGTIQNSNPVIADATGTVSIWLSSSLAYKFVIEDMNGVIIETIDNINAVVASGGGSGGTQYWTLSGSTISNTNAGGVGAVSVGGNLTVGGTGLLSHGLILNDTEVTPKTATLTAANTMTASTTWRLPVADSAGCLQSDGLGNLIISPCTGGGGGGSAVGPTGAVQLQAGSGAFTGSGNITFASSTQTLTITSASSSDAGLIVLTGDVQADNGFDAVVNSAPTTPLNWNVIQAPYGGMAALSFTASNYIQVGYSSTTPTVTTGDTFNPGALHYVTGTGLQVYNGSGWATLATGGSTSPGGATCNVQYNSSGFAGSANFTFNCAADPVTNLVVVRQPTTGSAGFDVQGGYIQSDYGLLVPASGTTTSWQNINVPTGGVYAKSLYAINYTNIGASNTAPVPTTGQPAFTTTTNLGALYCDTSVSPCIPRVWDGSGGWTALGGGGGGGTPGGGAFSIQVNNGGSFGGATNFVAPISSGAVTQVTLANASFLTQGNTAGFDASQCGQTGFVSNCIQAPFGGVTALGGVFGGANGTTPVALYIVGTGVSGSQRAVMSFTNSGGSDIWSQGTDFVANGGNDFFLIANGAATSSLTGNHTTGNLGILTTASATSGVALTVAGLINEPGITLSGGFMQADQGFVASSACTAYNCFQTVGGFRANDTGGSGVAAFTVNNTAVIDQNRNGTFANLTVTGTCSGCGGGSSYWQLSGSLLEPTSTSYTVTSTNSGTNLTFQNSNGNFEVNGNGAVSAAGVGSFNGGIDVNNTATNAIQTTGNINACSGGGCSGGAALSVGGTPVITSARGATFAAVVNTNAGISSGAGISATGYNINGGFFGQTHTVTIGSCSIFFEGGIAYAFSGC